jgi:hypothetical protein
MRMKPAGIAVTVIALLLSASLVFADTSSPIIVNWDSRTAGCPATISQASNLVFRVSGINDLLIDFKTGERTQFQFRTKSWPVSVVPTQNPFSLQAGFQVAPGCPDDATLVNQLTAIRNISDPQITPTVDTAGSISLSETVGAARSHAEIALVESEYDNSACSSVFSAHSDDMVVQWIKSLSSPAPHYVDFTVTASPNENYQLTVSELWMGKSVRDGVLSWECGEKDILTLSAGPLVTTLPYRTYGQQQVPIAGGTTQNQLVVSGTTNANVLGAALLNYNFPAVPKLPPWTGFALSVGPVYALNSAPSVSKLGLFVGGSFHLYRSIFITPGAHIGQFADYPAGFHSGTPIPPNYGALNPVTRNTVHFAIGITFKTTTFKKSSQNNAGSDTNGATTNSGTKSNAKPSQQTSGNQGNSTPK